MTQKNIYWGDIHNHCGISYGYGSLENALVRAREQLDFCAIIGHAAWHDMPEDENLKHLRDYHKKGFAKLAKNWDYVKQTIEKANVPYKFITFQGYEVHSRKYGDYHFLSPSIDLPIVEGKSPFDIVKKILPTPVIAIPHHIAYIPNYRGINWEEFSNDISPVVEVYSKHGCAISDLSPYEYLHTMGPRDSRNTVYSGLSYGYRFGFVASTDHHAGYPGSYGDGRLAVICKEKTRQEIWNAILARHTYAVTGDKIDCQFYINGAGIGSQIDGTNGRGIELKIRGCDTFDKIIIYKNLSPWKVICGEEIISVKKSNKYKVRIEMGWGKLLNGFLWHGNIKIEDGEIMSLESCFRGQNLLSPSDRDIKDTSNINNLDNRIIEKSKTTVEWKCSSFKNISTLHSQTAAIILEIFGDKRTMLNINLNGKKISISINELLTGSRGVQLNNYNSEAFLIHRAIPENKYYFKGYWNDLKKERACDVYNVEVRQNNKQCAWISPIYVLS